MLMTRQISTLQPTPAPPRPTHAPVSASGVGMKRCCESLAAACRMRALLTSFLPSLAAVRWMRRAAGLVLVVL